MSTTAIMAAQESAGEFVRFKPPFRGVEREKRQLSLAVPIHDWATRHVTGSASQQNKAKVRTHFGQFVKGEWIDDCMFMKRIEDRRVPETQKFAHDIWAISPRFNPQHRFFGTFIAPNWFIVFTMQSRDFLAKHEDHWHKEIDKCRRAWAAIFGSLRPFSGTKFSHYVTEKGEHCDERWYPI